MVNKHNNGYSFSLQAFYDITLFAPVGQSQFYFVISAMEGKPMPECVKEVEDKLATSWKVGQWYPHFIALPISESVRNFV